MAGAYGLDYAVAFTLMDLFEVKAAERRQMFDDLRVMEAAAIEQMNKKQ